MYELVPSAVVESIVPSLVKSQRYSAMLPSGSEAVAVRVTVKGAVPEEGFASRLTVGSWLAVIEMDRAAVSVIPMACSVSYFSPRRNSVAGTMEIPSLSSLSFPLYTRNLFASG